MAASTWAASARSAGPGGLGGLVLVVRLPGHRPQRLQPAEPRDVLLAGRPQLSRAGTRCRSWAGRRGRGGCRGGPLPGLLLAHPGLGESPAGPVGLGQRGSHLGRAGGGGQLGPPVLQVRLCRGQPVAGVQGVLPAPLPVG